MFRKNYAHNYVHTYLDHEILCFYQNVFIPHYCKYEIKGLTEIFHFLNFTGEPP